VLTWKSVPQSLWSKQCSKQLLRVAGRTEAQCRLKRSFVGQSTDDDDVRNSVFVYGLTALDSVGVSWPYCKSAVFEDGWKRSEKLYDRNAGTHLSAAAAAAAGASDGWLMRTRRSVPTTSPMTSRHVGGEAKTRARALPVVYSPEVRRLTKCGSAVSPQFFQVLVWNDLGGPSIRGWAIYDAQRLTVAWPVYVHVCCLSRL